MGLERKTIAAFGDELFDAWRSARQIAPLTDREPDITIEEAYQVQLHTIERRIGEGERVVGKKIGITARAVMQMLKVDQPDFGHLLSGMTNSFANRAARERSPSSSTKTSPGRASPDRRFSPRPSASCRHSRS
jgi:2-keto-4-pentenoate hydratase